MKWQQGKGAAFYFLSKWKLNKIDTQRRKIQLAEGGGEMTVLGKMRHTHMKHSEIKPNVTKFMC